MEAMGRRAREAALALAEAPDAARRGAVEAAAAALRAASGRVLAANREDLERARARGLSEAMQDRLALDPARVEATAAGLEAVAARPDPLARDLGEWRVERNGLRIRRVPAPLGVVAVIYEARPGVTADAAGLCLRSGNAAVLRCGSDSASSSAAILEAMREGARAAGLPEDSAQAPPPGAGREAVGILLSMEGLVDVAVPRGGRGLVERVRREARVPVFSHLEGVCSTYLHESADAAMAARLVVDAKMRRVSVCGACEALLVDRAGAGRLLPPVLDALFAAGAEVRGCPETAALDGRVSPASEADWGREFLAPVLACRVVSGLEEALGFIRRHGSAHTDAIVAEDEAAAEQFLSRLDSAIVMHNSSTQFADGGEFGLGAEMGIATGRLHARGPVGADQLTTFRYRVRGDGRGRG